MKYVKQNRPPPGTWFLIDEATRNLSNRNFMEKRQKKFIVFAHAARVLGHAVNYTAPLDALDSQLTPLVHMKCSEGRIKRNERVAVFKVRLNMWKRDPKTKELKFGRLPVLFNNEELEIETFAYPLPSAKLLHEYKRMKAENLDQIIDEAIASDEREDESGSKIDFNAAMARLLKNPNDWRRQEGTKKGEWDRAKIRVETGIKSRDNIDDLLYAVDKALREGISK